MADDKDTKGPDDTEAEGMQDKPWWAEAVREMTAVGLGTVFMTEETVRNYLRNRKLPKDVIAAFVENVAKKKEDFSGILSREVAKAFSRIDLSREMQKFLENHDMRVEAKISFTPRKKADRSGGTEEGNENE